MEVSWNIPGITISRPLTGNAHTVLDIYKLPQNGHKPSDSAEMSSQIERILRPLSMLLGYLARPGNCLACHIFLALFSARFTCSQWYHYFTCSPIAGSVNTSKALSKWWMVLSEALEFLHKLVCGIYNLEVFSVCDMNDSFILNKQKMLKCFSEYSFPVQNLFLERKWNFDERWERQ